MVELAWPSSLSGPALLRGSLPPITARLASVWLRLA